MPWQVLNLGGVGAVCARGCLYMHTANILLLHILLKETMENAKHFGLFCVIILIEECSSLLPPQNVIFLVVLAILVTTAFVVGFTFNFL